MKIRICGHNHRYDAENALMSFFPNELPEFVETDWEAQISLDGLQAETRFITGESAVCAAEDDSVRAAKHAIKLSFYRAAAIRTGRTLPWGSLTGVRPVKMLDRLTAEVLRDQYGVSPERVALCADAKAAADALKATLKPADAGAYIGIPFCPTRCAYCSFVSRDIGGAFKLAGDYVSVLEREIAAIAAEKPRIRALYIGGGTPTSLPGDLFLRVLNAAEKLGAAEKTVEAGRPDTVTREKLAMIRDFGARRVCVNPQTLNPAALKAIGRAHSPEDFFRAYDLAAEHGFEINCDLIMGLPADTAASFADGLSRVIGLKPENITVHSLSLKRGADIAENTNPDIGEMSAFAIAALRGAGYSPYYLYRQKRTAGAFENVGWTLAGHANEYNLLMMEELADVYGAGAGAVTKRVGGGQIRREFNPKYPKEYIERGAQKWFKTGTGSPT